jgi:hypothetical protein
MAAKSLRALEVLQKRKSLEEEEEVQELFNMKALAEHIEKTRVLYNQVKRKEILQNNVSRITENRKKKQSKVSENHKIEEKNTNFKIKQKEIKEKNKEKAIEELKYWSCQNNLYLNELNQVKKSEQEINFLKGKESLLKTKEKVLEKHRRSSLIIEQIREEQRQMDRVRKDIHEEILMQKKRVKSDKQLKDKDISSTRGKTFDLNFLITEPVSYFR